MIIKMPMFLTKIICFFNGITFDEYLENHKKELEFKKNIHIDEEYIFSELIDPNNYINNFISRINRYKKQLNNLEMKNKKLQDENTILKKENETLKQEINIWKKLS